MLFFRLLGLLVSKTWQKWMEISTFALKIAFAPVIPEVFITEQKSRVFWSQTLCSQTHNRCISYPTKTKITPELLVERWRGFNQAEPASFCWSVCDGAGVTIHPSTLPQLYFYSLLGLRLWREPNPGKLLAFFSTAALMDRLTVAFSLFHIRSSPISTTALSTSLRLLSFFMWHSYFFRINAGYGSYETENLTFAFLNVHFYVRDYCFWRVTFIRKQFIYKAFENCLIGEA